MEIAADSSASDTMTMALEIVSDQLAEVGIRAEIKNYDESTWLETRKSGELGSFMSTWSADYNDPDNFIYTFFQLPGYGSDEPCSEGAYHCERRRASG